MPELPDVRAYITCLEQRVLGRVLEKGQVRSPFLLRTVSPPLKEAEGREVQSLERIGKRIVLGLEGDLFLVFHLMIAGRFRWEDGAPAKPPSKLAQAAFTFAESGRLTLTEVAKKKRASLHLAQGRENLAMFDRGGLDLFAASVDGFTERLRLRNHTLKRALTDPTLFDGIGNAYSDEILHAARLSPVRLTQRLSDEEAARLHERAKAVLTDWTERLRKQFAKKFPGPGDITAFRPEFAVHGKFGEACPVCGTPVQRIVYAENETNYCPERQTGGKILADRSLSRLLKDDWPRTIEELEESRGGE